MPHASSGAALFIALLAASCGSAPAQTASPDTSAQAIAALDARLQGQWRLEKFVPVEPLGTALQALLEFQYANMIIRIDRGHLVADSPGLHIERSYRIRDTEGDGFKVIVTDEQGVAYVSRCNLKADGVLEAQLVTDPWRGTATLRHTGS